jgi:hypothetical protein
MWAAINLVSGWFLVYPLTKEEIRKHWLKRQALGKFNYSLAMLDLDLDRKEWADELEKRRKSALGLEANPESGHH